MANKRLVVAGLDDVAVMGQLNAIRSGMPFVARSAALKRRAGKGNSYQPFRIEVPILDAFWIDGKGITDMLCYRNINDDRPIP